MLRPALVAALSALVIGCGDTATDVANRGNPRSDGHQKMIALLRQIDGTTPDTNLYMGDRDIRQLEATLATLPNDATDQRFKVLWMLGSNSVRLGRTERGIEYLKQANLLLPEAQSQLSRFEHELFLLHVATAWLRLGETQNCVHCQNSESCILPIKGGGVHAHPEGARQAIDALGVLLKRNPKNATARWLLNLAHMLVGTYPDAVDPQFRIDPERFESAEPFPRFMNVAADVGVNAFNLCGGSIIDDFNGDGFLDIVSSTWETDGQILHFRNNRDGTFLDVTEQSGLQGIFGGLNDVQADFDNDGDLDVLVLRGGWWNENGRHPKSLLQNDGRGNFRDVTFECGLGEVHYPTQTAAWADFDNDGDLDLYVGNEGYPCQLFENDGKGHFRDIAPRAGVVNDRFTKGVVWGDYNGDRLPDLYLSNYREENRLYRNNGNGTFTDVAPELGLTGPISSFPTWFWDFDNDGALDLFVSAWWPDVKYVAEEFFSEPVETEFMCLYRGDGRGGFQNVAAERGLHRYALPMGANFGDLDNDGYPDFYLGTGYPEYEGLMPNLVFHNRRGERFADVTFASGMGHLQKGHGVSFGDLDNDGDQDLHIQMGGAFPGDAFGNLLYENPGMGNHSLTLRLVGTRSNRFGVGARIRAEFTENGTTRSVYAWVNSGGSFGANPLRPQIGLGEATVVDLLEIYWPTSDTTQRFRNVPADRFIEVTEGRPEFRQQPWKAVSFRRLAKPAREKSGA
jgi:hypothetical protein